MLTRRSFVFILVCLILFGGQAVSAQKQFQLTILHTNDLHGHIFPFAYTEEGRSKQEVASVGGAARRATLIRRLRKEIKHPTILVDCGDTFTRGPLTNAYEGIADVEAMNALGYEIGVIGNNEFKAKDGTEVEDAEGAKSALLNVIKRARFPWLCANAHDEKGALLEGVFPYVVREIQGVRVGFFGITPPRVAKYPQIAGWKISDPIKTAQKWIPEIRKHCDILIALTHIGFDLDRLLAANTTGIDAIVGGDSHTFLYKAEEVANAEGKKIPIVQDGEFGVNLGRFDLRFIANEAGKWSLAGFDYRLIPVSADIPEAPDVVARLQPYLQPMLQVVGRIPKVGNTPEERTQITYHLLTEALRQQTSSDYALLPDDSGFDVFRHTEITRYDLCAVWPFKNNMVTASLTGEEIAELQKKVKNTILAGKGTPEAQKTYTVAFVDFTAHSAYALSKNRTKDTGQDFREAVMRYLKR
jgi:5'-nucleotidase